MKATLPLMLLLLILSSCRSSVVQDDHHIMCQQVIERGSQSVADAKQMVLVDSGALFGFDPARVYIRYHVYLPEEQPHMSVHTARAHCIDTVEEVVNTFNQDPKSRPFMNNERLDRNHFEVIITYHTPSEEYVIPGNIAYVSSKEDLIQFAVYNPLSQQLEVNYEESYEKGFSIVNAKNLLRKRKISLAQL